ncbi:MBL fold metallo-hydrolase [Gorillibacterium sp. sgz5001074]|uniref:MBL fold metallo-hydrolase n=1 Tax=Gorillibacterium sp. sgz5001074 TaxID=3446695 RepID=UPI003F66E00D
MSKFERITEHITLMHAEHEADRPILAAIAGERRTLLLDAGNSTAHAALFRAELDRRGIRRPELLVLTHWHWDHTFGMAGWNIPAVAQEETAAALAVLTGADWSEAGLARLIREGYASDSTVRHIRAEYGEELGAIRVVRPEILFRDRITFDLGGVTCEVERVESDHSPDSCFVYVAEDRVLFTGDALGPSVYGGPRRYTADRFLRLMDRIRGSGAEIIVESHGVPMSREAFAEDIRPWEELARIVRESSPSAGTEEWTAELRRVLGVQSLSADLVKAAEYFAAGRAG